MRSLAEILAVSLRVALSMRTAVLMRQVGQGKPHISPESNTRNIVDRRGDTVRCTFSTAGRHGFLDGLSGSMPHSFHSSGEGLS